MLSLRTAWVIEDLVVKTKQNILPSPRTPPSFVQSQKIEVPTMKSSGTISPWHFSNLSDL